ncbi:MAG: hypothetical protein V1729_02650 [Candidatus Woesearchaeota archaeon]
MKATAAKLYQTGDHAQTTRLELVKKPSLEELMKYSVAVDFSKATTRPGNLCCLVKEAKRLLCDNPNADVTRIETDIEEVLLLDADGLDQFAQVFVDAHMDKYDFKPGTCGLAGIRYINTYAGEMGLAMFKTRIKRGRNTLAKVFRKSHIDEATASRILTEDSPYRVDVDNQTLTYVLGDCSAARALFETDDGADMMIDWVDANKNMKIVDYEEKDKPTYRAKHLHIEYNGLVRELQLMTVEVENVSKQDLYHGFDKNDVAVLAYKSQM